MSIINWDKPTKIRSTKEHNQMYSSDSGIDGTYVSNMSEEDMLKWKGKKILKSDNPRIEIRKVAGSNILIIVSSKPELHFTISTNGRIEMNYNEMQEFKQVIDEACQILKQETN